MLKTNTLQLAQITLKIDPVLKEKTLSKVRQEGFTLKALITMAMRAYLDNNLILGLRHKTEEPSEYLLETIREAEEDLKQGRTSPTFNNVKEAIKWLDGKNRQYAN